MEVRLKPGSWDAVHPPPGYRVVLLTAGDDPATTTASHFDQQFFVVGAQLPEPTVNVTAAIWRGASSGGGEVPDTALSFDPDAFTREHAGAAIRAGVASVLSHLTGIVIWLD